MEIQRKSIETPRQMSIESTIFRAPEDPAKTKYAEADIESCISAIQQHRMSMGEASRTFGVPKSTINFRMSKKWTGKKRLGPSTVLTIAEESKLVRWIQEMERRGFPLGKRAIFTKVKHYLDQTSRSTTFKNNVPGNKWLRLFLRRHKQLSLRKPENVTMAAATVSEADIRKWFTEIHCYLRDNDMLDILKDPRRILNGDETCFLFDPVTKSVIASKGNRNVYTVQRSDPKKNVTVLFTFDAEGYAFPPDIILPFKRLSRQLLTSFGTDWGVGKSDKGWMDSDNFMVYIRNILYPSLLKRNVSFPVIYFVDGHTSHTGIEAAELCKELNIILIALYPNATHILQPADVAIFKPLKGSWNSCMEEWKLQNGAKNFTIEQFGPLLQKAMHRGISVATIHAGFRRCGLYPFDADAVDYTRCIASSKQPVAILSRSEPIATEIISSSVLVDQNDLEKAVQLIGPERISSYNDNIEHNFQGSDKVLFNLYHQFFSKYGNSSEDFGHNQKADLISNPAEESTSSTLTGEKTQPTVENLNVGRNSDENSVILGNITNTNVLHRRTSISTHLILPSTPKRKNVLRKYALKRHFVLTASERLQELNEKEIEKLKMVRKKQENLEKRALKKKQREEELVKKKELKEERLKDQKEKKTPVKKTARNVRKKC